MRRCFAPGRLFCGRVGAEQGFSPAGHGDAALSAVAPAYRDVEVAFHARAAGMDGMKFGSVSLEHVHGGPVLMLQGLLLPSQKTLSFSEASTRSKGMVMRRWNNRSRRNKGMCPEIPCRQSPTKSRQRHECRSARFLVLLLRAWPQQANAGRGIKRDGGKRGCLDGLDYRT